MDVVLVIFRSAKQLQWQGQLEVCVLRWVGVGEGGVGGGGGGAVQLFTTEHVLEERARENNSGWSMTYH